MTESLAGLTDGELLRSIRQGSEPALEVLLRRHYRTIFRFAFRMSGSKADAEDITQIALVKMARAIRGFQGNAKFTTWAYRITVNASNDFLRKRIRTDERELEYAERKEEERAAKNPELSGVVASALHALPEKERSAILLTYYEGFNHREAAEVLGCAETTVSWRIFNAKKKLKKQLQKELDL